MSLESTQTALEAERYWGEEITRKQSYQTSEGYTDSGRYLSPMRYLNPQRSKNLQDRKGWIEGWEPRIKADEFIHGLGIGEAYLRHNGRPAKVKLVRSDINPPADFDISADLPRFSQGNEPPLNLTEKVNRVVMDRMREAKGHPNQNAHNSPTADEADPKKHPRKGKSPKEFPTKHHEITANQRRTDVIETARSEESTENSSNQKARQPDFLKIQASPQPNEAVQPDAKGEDEKRTEKLDWFSTWDED
jgi:hypothetical protein